MRRVDGTWEQVDLCGGAKPNRLEVAFDGDTVWALCDATLVRYDDETKANVVSYPNDGSVTMMPLARGFVLLGQTKVFALKDGAIAPLYTVDDTNIAPQCGRAPDDMYRTRAGGIGTDNQLEHFDGTSWTPVTGVVPQSNQLSPCTHRNGHAYAGDFQLENGVVTRVGNDETIKRNLALFSVVDDSTSVFYGRLVDVEGAYHNGTSSADTYDVPAAKAFLWSAKSDGSIEYLGGAPMNFGGLYGGSGTDATFAIDPNHVFLAIGDDILEGTR